MADVVIVGAGPTGLACGIELTKRGVSAPPKDVKTMERWARQLGLTPDTEEWQNFLDQSDVARGRIPADVLSDDLRDQLLELNTLYERKLSK